MKMNTWTKLLVLLVWLVETIEIVNGEGGYSDGYNYPKPRYQLTYPTFRPYVLKVEQPEEVILTTQQPKVKCPEPEKIPFIPPEHLEQDKRLRETIVEQENKLSNQERLVKDQEGEIGDQTDKLRQQQREIEETRQTLERREEELDERERAIGKQQEQITILEEEIRRLRGQPNLGVVLGDKIISFVEEEKKKAALEAENEGEGEIEIIRRRTEERRTSSVQDEDSGSIGGGGTEGGTIRETSRSSSSRFSSSGGGTLTGDISLDNDDLGFTAGAGGGSRSSSSFSSSSRSSSSGSRSRGGSSDDDTASSNKISSFQRGRDREGQASRNRLSVAYGTPLFSSASSQRSFTIPRPSTNSQSRKRKETGTDKFRTVEEVTQTCGSNITCWRKLRLQLENGRV